MAKDINNSVSNTLLSRSKGNDTIYNTGNKVTIDAGAGNDSVYYCNDITITGGTGKDLISLDVFAGNNLIQYAAGDGNDTIYGFNLTSTLQIGVGNGTYSTQASGYDVVVKVGKGTITLKDAYANFDTLNINKKATKLEKKAIQLGDDYNANDFLRGSISIVGSANNDEIRSGGNSVTISTGTGDDNINNNGSKAKVFGGDGFIVFQNVTTSTKFNINGTTYKVSGSKLK